MERKHLIIACLWLATVIAIGYDVMARFGPGYALLAKAAAIGIPILFIERSRRKKRRQKKTQL